MRWAQAWACLHGLQQRSTVNIRRLSGEIGILVAGVGVDRYGVGTDEKGGYGHGRLTGGCCRRRGGHSRGRECWRGCDVKGYRRGGGNRGALAGAVGMENSLMVVRVGVVQRVSVRAVAGC